MNKCGIWCVFFFWPADSQVAAWTVSAASLLVKRCGFDSLRLTAVRYTPQQGALVAASLLGKLEFYSSNLSIKNVRYWFL